MLDKHVKQQKQKHKLCESAKARKKWHEISISMIHFDIRWCTRSAEVGNARFVDKKELRADEMK